MRKLVYILTILFFVSCGTKEESKDKLKQAPEVVTSDEKDNNEWIFEKVQESKLVFKGGKAFETNLFELEYIGQVPVDGKAPYLIFSGRYCDECDANISIYSHSPSDGELDVDFGQNRFQYPGTEKDYETDIVLYNSRAFYGQVLDKAKGVIWYQNNLLENGKMGHSVYLLRIDHDALTDTIYNDNGNIAETIKFVKKGLCKEITGRKYKSEP